jgi:flagellin
VADNSGSEGTDTLSNVRYIEFSDQTYDTTDTSSVATATSALAASLAASPAFAVVGTAPQAAAPSGASSSSGGGSSSPHGYGSLFGVGGNSALAMIDRAMETVSNERAKLGAILNRLESRRDAIMSEMDNTKAAISPIRDTDYAITMTRFIKEQIRQQVAYTMLGHANMSVQQVTTLLK